MNQLNKIVVIIYFVISITPNLIFAQYNKKKIHINFTNNKIVDVIKLSSNQGFVKLITNMSEIDKIKSGAYKGYTYKKVQNSLVFNNQKPIFLSEDEQFIYQNVTENRLVTIKDIWIEDSVSIKLYNLDNNILTLQDEIVKPMPFSYIYNTRGSIILFTDYDERFGRSIEIYSNSDLKYITKINPFENVGFQDVTFYEDDLFLYVLFEPSLSNHYPKGKIKIYKISVVTGKIISEINFNVTMDICGFDVANGYYLLYSYNQIAKYNNQGEVEWSRNITIPRKEVKADLKNEILYLGLSDKITALNLKNGQTLWERSFSDFYKENLLSPTNKIPNIEIRPIFFNIVDNQLILLIGQTSKGLNIRNYPKYLISLFTLDKNGNISFSERKISLETNIFKVFVQSINNFTFVLDSLVITYEK